MRIRSVRWIGAVAAVGALVTAGCSDDGGDQADDAGASETTPSVEPDLAAYCDAELAMETVPEPEIDYATIRRSAWCWSSPSLTIPRCFP